jgi:hypothetical protein
VPQAQTFTFTGLGPLGYYNYVDTAKDTMLIAETGQTYGIRATEEGLAVPPGDGRWVAATPPSPPPPAPAKPAVTVPAAPEGGAA